MGWCYAFSTADLLSYKLGQKISAADIAMNFSNTILNKFQKKLGSGDDSFDDGGIVHKAIKKIKERGGACLESRLKSDNFNNKSLKSVLKTINTVKNHPLVFNSSFCTQSIQNMFVGLNAKQINAITDINKRLESTDITTALADKACEPRISLSHIKVHRTGTKSPAESKSVFNEINNQLDRKNIVSIGFNGDLLEDPFPENADLNHESVVVGRRFNKEFKECEYLIRNSWGKDCSFYPYECEDGNIWVPKEKLSSSYIEATYIE